SYAGLLPRLVYSLLTVGRQASALAVPTVRNLYLLSVPGHFGIVHLPGGLHILEEELASLFGVSLGHVKDEFVVNESDDWQPVLLAEAEGVLSGVRPPALNHGVRHLGIDPPPDSTGGQDHLVLRVHVDLPLHQAGVDLVLVEDPLPDLQEGVGFGLGDLEL